MTMEETFLDFVNIFEYIFVFLVNITASLNSIYLTLFTIGYQNSSNNTYLKPLATPLRRLKRGSNRGQCIIGPILPLHSQVKIYTRDDNPYKYKRTSFIISLGSMVARFSKYHTVMFGRLPWALLAISGFLVIVQAGVYKRASTQERICGYDVIILFHDKVNYNPRIMINLARNCDFLKIYSSFCTFRDVPKLILTN